MEKDEKVIDITRGLNQRLYRKPSPSMENLMAAAIRVMNMNDKRIVKLEKDIRRTQVQLDLLASVFIAVCILSVVWVTQ